MSVFAVGSLSGSPGATALVLELAAAWPRRCLVVEADADGGCMAARCDVPLRPGLTELAAAARSGAFDPDDVWRFVQATGRGLELVVAHPSAHTVTSALRAAAAPIAATLTRLDEVDVVIDVGRFRPDSPASALVHAADRRIVASGARLEDAVALVHAEDLLHGLGGAEVVLTGVGEHRSADIASATGLPVIDLRPTAGRRRRSDGSRLARLVDHLGSAGPDSADAVSETADSHIAHEGVPA